jgi:hypothetical protein
MAKNQSQFWRMLLAVFGVASSVACAPRITLSLRAEQAGSATATARPLVPKDKVASGQSLFFWARVDSPTYLYVLSYSPMGWSTLHFPQAGDFLATPGNWIRLPAGRDVITLDYEPGPERFVIVASTNPLDQQLCSELRLFCPETGPAVRRRTRGDDKEKPRSPPPNTQKPPPTAPGKEPTDRDPQLIQEDVPGNWVVRQRGAGKVILSFSIDHTAG